MSSAKDGRVTTTEDNEARDQGALDVVAYHRQRIEPVPESSALGGSER